MTSDERPLRLVVFGPSIFADVDNPPATSTRALLGALTATGHAVTHLEPRGNSLMDRQLRMRGSVSLRALNARYPDLRARSHDLPRGQQRTVWFGTEVSTADAVLALPDTADDVLALIAAFETPHLVRLVPVGAVGDVELAAPTCAERREPRDGRTGIVAVAYDDVPSSDIEAVPEGIDRIVVGAADLPGWRYLPEVEVAERYRSTSVALVLDGEERPGAEARLLLPIAAGCRVVTTRRAGDAPRVDGIDRVEPSRLAEAVIRIDERTVATLPDRYDAAVVAERLVATVRTTLVKKRAAASASSWRA